MLIVDPKEGFLELKKDLPRWRKEVLESRDNNIWEFKLCLKFTFKMETRWRQAWNFPRTFVPTKNGAKGSFEFVRNNRTTRIPFPLRKIEGITSRFAGNDDNFQIKLLNFVLSRNRKIYFPRRTAETIIRINRWEK